MNLNTFGFTFSGGIEKTSGMKWVNNSGIKKACKKHIYYFCFS